MTGDDMTEYLKDIVARADEEMDAGSLEGAIGYLRGGLRMVLIALETQKGFKERFGGSDDSDD